ncbi:MAG: SGNH/GDSL hydrolase family protein [Burkholderiales bacterium]|jgi:outer membrane lipase/esterase|nr:SGNH/GDSL hydrolase family protein [Burkholderiales bacterium]
MNLLSHALRHGARAIAIVALAHATSAAAFSKLVVFGDSLSDTGNNAAVIGANPSQVITGDRYIPIQAYNTGGTYSNGPVWTTVFGNALGLASTPFRQGGTNFAHGGATTGTNGPLFGFPPSLKTQVGSYVGLNGGAADPNALYVIAGGGNNVIDAIESFLPALSADPPTANPEQIYDASLAAAGAYAVDIGDMLDGLQAAGAQHIVVWNVPLIGLTPLVQSYGVTASVLGILISDAFNTALDDVLGGYDDVLLFDVAGLFAQVALDPSRFGFTNVDNACGAASAGCDPATALFWDGIHPTAAGHRVIAQGMLAVVPEPSTVFAMLAGGAVLLVGVARRRAVAPAV